MLNKLLSKFNLKLYGPAPNTEDHSNLLHWLIDYTFITNKIDVTTMLADLEVDAYKPTFPV